VVKLTNSIEKFCNDKIIDCEEVFANANTTGDEVFLKGMLNHGGETNALLMNIGKRQAYMEVLDFMRGLKNDNTN